MSPIMSDDLDNFRLDSDSFGQAAVSLRWDLCSMDLISLDIPRILKRVRYELVRYDTYVSISVVTQERRDKLGLGNERSPCEEARRRRGFLKGLSLKFVARTVSRYRYF